MKRNLAGVALLAFGLLGVSGVFGDAEAGESRAFAGQATAYGTRINYQIPNYLVVTELLDGASPISQAVLESSGFARGFASFPYPGDTVVTAPGTAASFGLGPAGAVAYPLYVTADHPAVPSATFADPSGTLSLTAEAASTRTAAAARLVPGAAPPDTVASGTATDTLVEQLEDGTIASTAESRVEGLAFSEGLLEIAGVRSRSVARLEPGAEKPTVESSLDITGATIAGLNVQITPEGFVLAGQTVPVPVAEVTKSLSDAMAEAGLTVRIVEGETLENGVVADSLVVESRQTVPVPGSPTGVAVYRFGGTIASLTVGPGVPGLPVPSLTGTQPSASPGAAPASTPAGGVLSGGSTSLSPSSTGGSSSPAPSAAGASVNQPEVIAVARDFGDDMAFFYVAIAVGAGLLAASSSIWRPKGVHSLWKDF